MTFDQISEANRRRCSRWHPGFPDDDAWTGADWSNAMCGEAGEAANVVKKLRRIEAGYSDYKGDNDRSILLAKLGDELADVFLYADLLAAKYGIDWPAAIAEKFNKVSEAQGFPDRIEPTPTTQRTVDEVYNALISDKANEMSDRQLLALVTNKLADVAS